MKLPEKNDIHAGMIDTTRMYSTQRFVFSIHLFSTYANYPHTMTGYPPDQLKDAFDNHGDILKQEFEKIRSKYDDSGIKGDETEAIVGEFLSEYLPRNYGWGSGEVFDRRGQTSREQDIIICNQHHPYTYSQGGRGLFFREGVEAVVEVKSVLNEEAIRNSIKKCLSLRDLEANFPKQTRGYTVSEERLNLLPFAVFSFETPYKPETLYEKMVDLQDEMVEERNDTIDILFVLDNALITDTKEFDRLKPMSGEQIMEGVNLQMPLYDVSTNMNPILFDFMIYLQDRMPQIQYMPNIINNYIEAAVTDT